MGTKKKSVIRRVKLFVWFIIILLMLFIGILIGVDNSARVALHFVMWETTELSIFLWVLLSFISGVTLGSLLGNLQRIMQFRSKIYSKKPSK